MSVHDRNFSWLQPLLLAVRLRVSICVWLVVLGAPGIGVAAPLERGPLLDRGALPAPTVPSALASSGRTLVTGAAGAAYVYEKSGPFWSSEAPAATLVASDGTADDGFGRLVASSGSAIAVRANGAVYVYSEPPGGWSGVLHESAKLVVPAGGHISFPDRGLAMTGSTVAVWNDDGVHLFRRPSSGWSGVITESAVLSLGHRFGIVTAAISDDAVTAVGLRVRGGNGTPIVEDWSVDTFRPTTGGGWSGAISPATRAALVRPRDVDIRGADFTGRTAVVLGQSETSNAAAAYLFAEPKAGWTGSVRAMSKTADLRREGNQGSALRVSPTRVMIDRVEPGPLKPGSTNDSITVFDKPTGGWPPIIPATATTPDFIGAADGDAELNGDEILMPGAAGVLTPGPGEIIHFRIEPPVELTRADLSGVPSRKPQLTLALRVSPRADPLRQVSITLPRGLRFNSQHSTRTHLSTIPRAARPSVSSTRHGITITLGNPARNVVLILAAGAIRTESDLTRELSRLQRTANRRHRATQLTLSLPVRATDTAAVTTTRYAAITLTLRPHR